MRCENLGTMTQARAATIAGIPLLIAEPDAPSGAMPVVFWCHGFRADALAHAGELERCADRGFLAVGIDAVAHGARRRDDLMARVAASPDGALPVMLDLVDRGVRELPALVDGLDARFQIDRARLSLVGISMGAFQAYHGIASGVPLRSVVALLGSPHWDDPRSPHRAITGFRDVALLSITAEHDGHVPPGPARRLHLDLAIRYPAGRHRYHELRGAGHLTTGPQWDEAMQATMEWLEQMG
jgi:pimeloyl-ACP methyl ester carboxylesterase